MTNQEAFTTAVLAIVAQGKRSIDLDFGCRYRGPDNLKCAIGHLIPDDQYTPSLEATPLEAIIDKIPALAGLNSKMLRQLQHAHDRTDDFDFLFVEEFTMSARAVANRFHLTFPDL